MPGIEMCLSEKELWRSLVSNGVDPLDMEEWKNFEMFLPAENLPAWIAKAEMGSSKGRVTLRAETWTQRPGLAGACWAGGLEMLPREG